MITLICWQIMKLCVEERGSKLDKAFDTWCCSATCQGVYLGLQANIGRPILLSDGFRWTLLKCINGDQQAHSAQSFLALKAECNSKLAVALQMMEEYFNPMVDPRSVVNMIPQLIYNWGSKFPCVDCSRFYTVVLEKGDTLIALASIRCINEKKPPCVMLFV
nr:increased DNA methylation 1-like isoform X1 [Coffea arabica]